MLSISTALSGVKSPARSFYGRSVAEPLADARGILGFRGIPVENHCFTEINYRTPLREKRYLQLAVRIGYVSLDPRALFVAHHKSRIS